MHFANQLRSSTTSSSNIPAHHSLPLPPFFSPLRRGVHASVYDKNVDDEAVQPKAVPEEVIQAKSEEEYWEPDPQTGVFGPASELNEETTGLHSSSANATEDSVLEQKTFFRPLEDLEKPPPPSS
ncbi:hypothetical protein LguiA_024283 [Lonicera macranthoides]